MSLNLDCVVSPLARWVRHMSVKRYALYQRLFHEKKRRDSCKSYFHSISMHLSRIPSMM